MMLCGEHARKLHACDSFFPKHIGRPPPRPRDFILRIRPAPYLYDLVVLGYVDAVDGANI